MNDENQIKYLYLLLGYTSILLIIFSLVKYMSIIQDNTGIALAILGAVFLGSFLDFEEKKMGISVNAKVIFRIGSLIILLVLVFIFI
jgi:hypothetical protein